MRFGVRLIRGGRDSPKGAEKFQKHKGEKMKKIQRIVLAFMLGIVPIQAVWADSRINELVEAASSGNLAQVKSLVEQGANVNAKDDRYGITTLIVASMEGQLSVVEYLISKGADVNAKANNGNTALIAASRVGHLSVVKCLVDKGANINATENIGTTALMFAANYGHLEVAQYLISKGANVNIVVSMQKDGTMYRFTALDFATIYKHNKIAEVLKRAGGKSAKDIR